MSGIKKFFEIPVNFQRDEEGNEVYFPPAYRKGFIVPNDQIKKRIRSLAYIHCYSNFVLIPLIIILPLFFPLKWCFPILLIFVLIMLIEQYIVTRMQIKGLEISSKKLSFLEHLVPNLYAQSNTSLWSEVILLGLLLIILLPGLFHSPYRLVVLLFFCFFGLLETACIHALYVKTREKRNQEV